MKLSIERAWSDAIALLREHAEFLLPVYGLFALVPAVAIALLLPMEATSGGTPQQLLATLQAYFAANIHWLLLSGLLTAFATATILVTLADPARPTVGQAMGRALALTPAFYVLTIIANIVIGMGLLLLIVPGLYLLGRLTLGHVHMAAERRMNPLWALGASWNTSKGNGWRIVFLIVLIFVVGLIAGMAAGAVLGVIGGLIGGAETARTVNVVVTTLFSSITALVILLVELTVYRQLAGAPAAEASNGI